MICVHKILESFDLINGFFHGNENKTLLWFNTINPCLGHVKPIEMIRNGRLDKLLQFIKCSLMENKGD